MRVMKASEFKAKCLEVMGQVEATGEPVVITKNGRPVSRLVPYRTVPKTLFGTLRGCIEVRGDIVSPLESEWEAAQ
jgi:prevent-host-death family protein